MFFRIKLSIFLKDLLQLNVITILKKRVKKSNKNRFILAVKTMVITLTPVSRTFRYKFQLGYT